MLISIQTKTIQLSGTINSRSRVVPCSCYKPATGGHKDIVVRTLYFGELSKRVFIWGDYSLIQIKRKRASAYASTRLR